MRRWGLVITVFYTLVVVVLLVPAAHLLGGSLTREGLAEFYGEWTVWLVIGLLAAGEALLLLLSVDAARPRLRPRSHLWVSIATTGLLVGLLTFAAVVALAAGALGDDLFEPPWVSPIDARWKILGVWLGLWLFWALVLYLHLREAAAPLSRALVWLMRGSVLELLIAVPCHVVVRQREDCSAPLATGLGIASGIAVMLLAFGPGVLFLYRKRLAAYRARRREG
jgi:hypothetical protein